MRHFLLGLVALIWSVSNASAHTTHHQKHHTHHAMIAMSEQHPSMTDDHVCLRRALLNEAVGVKSTESRVTLGKLLISRTHARGFPNTVCGVYAQKHISNHGHTVRCEFSDSCITRKKAKFRVMDIARADRDARTAELEVAQNGPSDLLYFGTGSCPVISIRKVHKSPFVFCAPARR